MSLLDQYGKETEDRFSVVESNKVEVQYFGEALPISLEVGYDLSHNRTRVISPQQLLYEAKLELLRHI